MKPINYQYLIGQKFNKLQVLKIINTYQVLCKCDCGITKVMYRPGLLNGRTISCGCWKKKVLTFQTHGLSKSFFYRRWYAMLQRCNYPKSISYKNYGGRGIKVCNEWLKFSGFHKDMYQSFLEHSKLFGESNTTLERIDNNKNYQLLNCKWATRKEQNRNSRQNIFITYQGQTLTVAEWVEKLNLDYNTFYHRILRIKSGKSRKNMTLEEAIAKSSASLK